MNTCEYMRWRGAITSSPILNKSLVGLGRGVYAPSEQRLDGGLVSFDEFPFRNALDGHARGFELTLQRRSANKLAGWISYSYLRTKLTDSQTGLSFVADNDQRHLLNTYASYRLTDTWNLSSVFRFGSGPPIPGFFREVGSDFFLSDRR